jgi:hypothetical protein
LSPDPRFARSGDHTSGRCQTHWDGIDCRRDHPVDFTGEPRALSPVAHWLRLAVFRDRRIDYLVLTFPRPPRPPIRQSHLAHDLPVLSI